VDKVPVSLKVKKRGIKLVQYPFPPWASKQSWSWRR